MQTKLPITKKDKLKERVKLQQWVKALSIAKNFFIEFNESEQRIIQIAHECKEESAKNLYIRLLFYQIPL